MIIVDFSYNIVLISCNFLNGLLNTNTHVLRSIELIERDMQILEIYISG